MPDDAIFPALSRGDHEREVFDISVRDRASAASETLTYSLLAIAISLPHQFPEQPYD
jgi:hypothetical protein